MKLRIESDGTSHGTRVVNAETGEQIDGVREVTWEWERGYPVSARISLVDVETQATLMLDGRVVGLR
jgi:hypothetical protein